MQNDVDVDKPDKKLALTGDFFLYQTSSQAPNKAIVTI